MKLVTKIGVLVFAMFALTACPGKKGNNNANGLVAGACVIDASGTCVGGQPYYGAGGNWKAWLNVVNPALYSQFMMEHRMCRGYTCTAAGQNLLGVYVNLGQTSGEFTLTAYQYNRLGRSVTKQAQAYSTGVAGFNLVYQNMYFIQQPYTMQYPNNIMPPQTDTSIQIVSTYADASQMVLNTQVLYRGQILATGQLLGRPNYGYGGGYGGGYGYKPAVVVPGR